MSLNPNLRDFWEKKALYRVLYGGRMSGKTHEAAGMAILLSDCFKIRIACIRQFQARIADSVYTVLVNKIIEQGLTHRFNITKTGITNKVTGSEFIFYGIARNLNDIKGLEGIDITWIEEAEKLTFEQWFILEPTLIRKEGSEIWVVFNPQFQQDFVYQNFVVNPPKNSICRLINYTDNPFLGPQALLAIENNKEREPERFANKYLGEPMVDSEGVIIRRSWLQACVDAHLLLNIEPTGAKRVGFDLAGEGKDKCALVEAHGPLIMWSSMWRGTEDGLLKSCVLAYSHAEDKDCEIVYDVCGMGLGAGGKFKELNDEKTKRLVYTAFNAGAAVRNPDRINEIDPSSRKKNKDVFSNLKAQSWALVAKRAQNTYEAINLGKKYNQDEMIFFDSKMPNLEKLLAELSTPKRDRDNAGKFKVESKEDLRIRQIPSPDLADACIMSLANIKSSTIWSLDRPLI